MMKLGMCPINTRDENVGFTMERRNTVQRGMVLDAVRKLQNHPTADDVYTVIHQENPKVGKGTVYRNLNILSEAHEIRRVEISGGADRFDHTLCEHYHVLCVKCNALFDVDMEALPDLKKSIRDAHGVQFLDYDILFKGICPDCQDKEDMMSTPQKIIM